MEELQSIVQELDEAANWERLGQVRDRAARIRELIEEQPEGERERLRQQFEAILRWAPKERKRSHGGKRQSAGRKPSLPKPAKPAGDRPRQWIAAITGIDGEGWGLEEPEGREREILLHSEPDPWPQIRAYLLSRGGLRLRSRWEYERYRRWRCVSLRRGAPVDVVAVEAPHECAEAQGHWDPEGGADGMLEALERLYELHRTRPRSAGKVIWHGRQIYRLLVATTITHAGLVRRHRLWNGGERLTTDQILDFVCRIPRPGQLVGFSMGYDWAHWLLDLDPQQLYELKSGKTIEYEALEPEGSYKLRMIPSKLLIIRRLRSPAGIRYQLERHVHDAFSWYQCAFLKALEETVAVPAATRDVIAAGKARRGDDEEGAHELDTESLYASSEMWALSLMQRQLYLLCRRAGYDLDRFMGPGSLAEKILDEHGVREHMTELDPEVIPILSYAHFGGRFEDAALGRFDRLEAWDLSSAYPWAATQLPSFQGAFFERADGWAPGDLGLYRVRFSTRWRRDYWGPLPVRDRLQRIFWPLAGETWAWSPELEAMARNPEQWSFRVLHGWRVVLARPDVRPLSFLVDLYSRRRELREAGDPLQNIFRLGPNSLYGKLGQTVGRARYRFLPWASLITSMTRARLLDAISAAGPGQVIGVATDAIYTLRSPELPSQGLGGLGDWDGPKVLDNVLMVGSGFMRAFGWAADDPLGADGRRAALAEDRAYQRTRGVRPYEVPWAELMLAWDAFWSKHAPLVPVQVKVRRFVGIMLGLLWNHPEMIGSWIEQPRVIRFGSEKSPSWRQPPAGIVPGQQALWLRQRSQDRSRGLFAYDRFHADFEAQTERADAEDGPVR